MNERKTIKCYCDGSYSDKSPYPNKSGWGVLFENREHYSGQVDWLGMRQINGEVHAVIQACRIAMNMEVHLLRIFYDYKGMEEWASQKWKANNEVTKNFQKLFKVKDGKIYYGTENDDHLMEVRFSKVAAKDNKADDLATRAIGIKSVH